MVFMKIVYKIEVGLLKLNGLHTFKLDNFSTLLINYSNNVLITVELSTFFDLSSLFTKCRRGRFFCFRGLSLHPHVISFNLLNLGDLICSLPPKWRSTLYAVIQYSLVHQLTKITAS